MNEHDRGWRYSLLGSLIFVLPVLIVLQLVRIQVSPKQLEKIRLESEGWSNIQKTITPARGQIFDRWGALLAGNKTVYEIGVNLQTVQNPQTIAQTLNAVLGIDYADAYTAASIEHSDQAVYAVIADNVPQEEIDKLQILIDQMEEAYAGDNDKDTPSLQGLVYSPHLGRTYPEKMLASNLLGFVSGEGVGYFGVEERFNDLLAGKTKTVSIPLDPNRVREMPVVPDGASLVLTIDRAIQRSMEELIDDAVAESSSDSGTIIVLDPRNGEILAMATMPRLNLNEFWQYEEVFPNPETPFNRGVSEILEPGSVYKVLTMASALDAGAVKPETMFVDTGVIEVGGAIIYNWNMGAWGPQDMQGCMAHSLNVCLAWTATQLGTNDFYRYMQAFGIGHLTGVDLAGEVAGRLKSPGDSDWYQAELGTNAFGQGVSVTPLQMAMSVSAVANDGRMMAPHVVRSIVSDGYQHNIEPRVLGMPIKPETARLLSEMLAVSLETESSDALVTGYRVSGKTGTAEIPTPFGYTTNETNASFIGWGPTDDPQFLVYVWLEKPATSPWGSVVAAPVFRQAVERLVVLLNLPPDDVRFELNGN
jgi:cell division protein FtsI/penicillin-binding protein 2